MKNAGVTLEKVADLLGIVIVRLDSMEESIRDIKIDTKDIKSDIAEMKSDFKAYGKAIDADAITLIDHDRRISKLEKVA